MSLFRRSTSNPRSPRSTDGPDTLTTASSVRTRPTGVSRIASSKWFLGVGFVLLLLIALALGRETYRKYQITNEIRDQRQAIAVLEDSNQELEDYVSYLQTDNYRERVARERLGLQREGEQVVVVPEQVSQEPVLDSGDAEVSTNPKRWWRYFFSVKQS